MKRTFFLFILLLIAFVTSSGQEQKEIARFYVTHATQNGYDISESVLSMKMYTVFYTIGDELYMANVSDNEDSQSYGKIFDFKSKNYPETSDEFAYFVATFHWNYTNTYDTQRGTCVVEFTKIYKPQGIVSALKMITESLDVIEYTGVMEGSLDFSHFQ